MAQSTLSKCITMLLIMEAISEKVHGDRMLLSRPAPDQRTERVRDLVKHLAISCDFAPKGETVTAVALQDQGGSLTYWISSNTRLADTSRFLRCILNTVSKLVRPLQGSGKDRTTEKDKATLEKAIEKELCGMITFHVKGRLWQAHKRLVEAIQKEREFPRPPDIFEATLQRKHC